MVPYVPRHVRCEEGRALANPHVAKGALLLASEKGRGQGQEEKHL